MVGAVHDVQVVDRLQPFGLPAQFRERFGSDALKFVNSKSGRALNLRGINTRVVRPGDVRVGDVVRKLPA